MTPQQLSAIVNHYQKLVASGFIDQQAWIDELTTVKAAWAVYNAIPAAIFPLGMFTARSGELVVIDAYSRGDHGVHIASAATGAWHAFAAVEAGIHVALFAYHASYLPDVLTSANDLICARSWREVGIVPIDTATCAIADHAAYAPLNVEDDLYRLAGVAEQTCFSNSANADGGYAVFTSSDNEQTVAVYVQFYDIVG